ncbi:MAG: hypothetical protein EAZ08_09635 [Cytophagales bacterium]|nr:MAG: hypothetical protein EAZ08_09635 [Cytophagales bacterium]
MNTNKFLKVSLFLSCFFLVYACTPAKTVSDSSQNTVFTDDLAPFRIQFSETELKNSKPVHVVTEIPSTSSTPPIGSINADLDTLNARIANSNRNFTIKGFRIQVYSGMQRKDAELVITDLKKIFPNKTADLEYSQPNYKVKMGNFLDRVDAYQTYYKIREVYPSVSIVYEKIKVPRY